MRVVAVLVAALVAATAASAASITRTAKTASYSLTLVVGPKETMYTQAEAKSMHLKSGEVMVGESMAMDEPMAMKGEVVRHLEVKVKSRSTGAVSKAKPTITLSDATAKSTAAGLHVMGMQATEEGAADFHYGNNVSLKLGHTYRVGVVVKGEKASFSFKAS